MSIINFHCPSCWAELEGYSDWRGQIIDCPACQNEIDFDSVLDKLAKLQKSAKVNFAVNLEQAKLSDADNNLGKSQSVSSERESSIIYESSPKMRPLICEMCGSKDIVKTDGFFICQACGVKYSLEEARKLMFPAALSLTGTIKMDTSAKVENYYQIARRAKDGGNVKQGLKYYDLILQEEPDSWEANFYLFYFQAIACEISEISSTADSVKKCLPTILNLISSQDVDEQTKLSNYSELFASCHMITLTQARKAKEHVGLIGYVYREEYIGEYWSSVASSVAMLYHLGDLLTIRARSSSEKNKITELASNCWKAAMEIDSDYKIGSINVNTKQPMIKIYGEKTQKNEAGYKPPPIRKSHEGCYIATAVYKSYDCPEVLILRRFRDETLQKFFLGKIFIAIYYKISPFLVKYLGKTACFKSISQKTLNFIIRKIE